MTTNWDELEGWPLNVALCRLMGWTDFKKGQGYWVGTKDGQQRVLPDYANSIDAQIRDLVPKLGPDTEYAVMNRKSPSAWAGRDSLMLYFADGGFPALALGRAFGKALEATK